MYIIVNVVSVFLRQSWKLLPDYVLWVYIAVFLDLTGSGDWFCQELRTAIENHAMWNVCLMEARKHRTLILSN
ncbi:Uncharacterized protein HZ326_17336 [Fusarium oxysporum f. sp. albedinis]|nr:Uncharacterized protein HZ326_17336 [Fusarium oxysporum f. sp. albedinis]